jgi:hypothetical protein
MTVPAEAETPEINTTLLSLVLIFIPGIICYGIIAALAEKKGRDNVTMFLQIFMYGVFSYLFLYGAHLLRPGFFPDISTLAILNPAEIEKSPLNPRVIAWATLFGAIQGVLITLNLNRQFVLSLCRKVGLTGRFGDEDVWTLLLNSTDTDNWVTLRHKEHGLIYQGYVSGFSGGGEQRELLLINVRVFTSAEPVEQVGEIPFLYMAFKDSEVTLEFGPNPDNVAQKRSSWRWPISRLVSRKAP